MAKPIILCVDDEAIVLNSLESELRAAFGQDYGYEFAESGEEALELIDELHLDNDTIIMVISDWLMPGIKGDELLVRLHQRNPEIPAIMLTGHADKLAVQRAMHDAQLHCCMAKPWDATELISNISSGIRL